MKKLFFAASFLCTSICTQAQTITTIAGNGNDGFSGEGGPATNAEFSFPSGVGADKLGNIYLADNGHAVIHKIDTNGILTRFAGNGSTGYTGDGGPATAAKLFLFVLTGIAVDTAGNVFFSDGSVVRMVSTSGIISTVAGNGTYGSAGDGGPATAAELKAPTGICFDKAGNLYISDYQNSKIRMVNPMGIISTFAGTTIGFSGDGGPATTAQLKAPVGIASDDSGNIYVADVYNDRVRKIDKFGTITTFAGGDTFGVTQCEGCLGTHLQLPVPNGLAVDRFGDLFLLDAGNMRVYKITKSGLAYSVAGDGISGYSGDGGAATAASLRSPNMICFDKLGNLLISDKGNDRYRRVSLSTTATSSMYISPNHLAVYPNPVTHKNFTSNIATTTIEDAEMIVTNIIGQPVFKTTLKTNTPTDIHLPVPPGIYFISAITSTQKMTAKVLIE